MAEHRIRTDGWTAERQVTFLETLVTTRSVQASAEAAGMSRNGAYRLRERKDGALFAHLWDVALTPLSFEGDTRPPPSGRLLRLLGNHDRRKSGDFARFAAQRRKASEE